MFNGGESRDSMCEKRWGCVFSGRSAKGAGLVGERASRACVTEATSFDCGSVAQSSQHPLELRGVGSPPSEGLSVAGFNRIGVTNPTCQTHRAEFSPTTLLPEARLGLARSKLWD